MDKDEAMRRYGNAIAQILNKYAAVMDSKKVANDADGEKILDAWIEKKKGGKENAYSR